MESFRLALHHTFAPGYGQDEALSMDRFPSVFEGIPLCPWIMVKYTKWFLTAPEGKRFAYKLRKAWEGKKKKWSRNSQWQERASLFRFIFLSSWRSVVTLFLLYSHTSVSISFRDNSRKRTYLNPYHPVKKHSFIHSSNLLLIHLYSRPVTYVAQGMQGWAKHNLQLSGF